MNHQYKYPFFTLKDEAGDIIYSAEASFERFKKHRPNLTPAGELKKSGKKTPQNEDIFECLFDSQGIRIVGMAWSQQRHFAPIELDFTIPPGEENAGLPLEKVCLIGANGSGKSTVLSAMYSAIFSKTYNFTSDKDPFWTRLSLVFNGDRYDYVTCRLKPQSNHYSFVLVNQELDFFESDTVWRELEKLTNDPSQRGDNNRVDCLDHYYQQNADDFLAVMAPDETQQGTKSLGQKFTLNQSLEARRKVSRSQVLVSLDTVQQFWGELLYLVQKRQADFNRFAQHHANLTYKDLQREFDAQQPEFLSYLSRLWNEILDLVGLEFKPEYFSHPDTLSDEVDYYFRYKNAPDGNLQFAQLSAGLKNYLFKLGHIAALWFGDPIPSSFLLLDEPDAGLFPGYVDGIIHRYFTISKGAQMFATTHNPQVARQFRDYERYILALNEENRIEARRGMLKQGASIDRYLDGEFAGKYYSDEAEENYLFYKYLVSQLQTAAGEEKLRIAREIGRIQQIYKF